jgi:hypothetical protein
MRYVLGAFGVVVLLILVVLLVARRNPAPTSPTQTGKKQVVVTDFADKSATAQLTMRGEVTGDEDRRSIRISVSKQERVVEILKGYNETVENRQSFSNTDSAYSNFLSALENAGFALEKETSIKDERGVCPLGKRYVYKLVDGSDQVFRLWNTSCGAKQGSFGGDGGLVRTLFQNQIPDYRTLVRGVKL